MTEIMLDSRIGIGDELPPFSTEDVKNEPMLFNCDFDTAYVKGGPITRAFLRATDQTGFASVRESVVIDTRVHMLMPGWYPCIPGWHHDDVPRSRADGQPNYETPEYKARHVMALAGDDVAPTLFALGKALFEIPKLGRVVYADWHAEVERRVKIGELLAQHAPMNKLIFFDWLTWHRGVEARGNGWRWFGRMSAATHRKPTNEVRRQTQIYMSAVNAGW